MLKLFLFMVFVVILPTIVIDMVTIIIRYRRRNDHSGWKRARHFKKAAVYVEDKDE